MGEDTGDQARVVAGVDEALWDPISSATVLRSSPQFDERVLDAAAGDGATALPTAELVGPSGIVDAIDASEAMIERLRERAGDRMPQLRTHVVDPTTWPYTGYDLVQCARGVPRFADVDAGTEHLVQCARPGGRVVITVWAHGALGPLGEVLDSEPAAPLTIPHAETAGTFAHWLAERGLVDVRAEVVPRHVEVTPELAWDIAVATGLVATSDDPDDEEAAALRERVIARMRERDAASLDITTLIAVGHRPADG